MSNLPNTILTIRAEPPQVDSIQPIIKDAVDAPPLGNSEDVMPRRSLRCRRGRAGDRFRPTFSLKLTEDEIDEDIYSLTGALPRHHPRCRPVPLQEMLNRLVPGAPLAGLTPET
ncbi:hypothetical protein SETIT_8G226100v2 [Setaria italica]|uniref:Uncharacterized protein n=1 Tax=Setaria italica TaxID=4555 RepID=A0A368SAI6_SETIT|nr:hypothetical protein SETIT_8G226100v2 [Setaria italica]